MNTDELRQIAEAANEMDGWYPASVMWGALIEAVQSPSAEDAAFIAAASPDVVLGLLDKIAAVEAERDEAREAVRLLAGELARASELSGEVDVWEPRIDEALADPVVRRILEGG